MLYHFLVQRDCIFAALLIFFNKMCGIIYELLKILKMDF